MANSRYMDRYLNRNIINDLPKKMVFLTGPRQVGKTFLAKQIMSSFQKPLYLNYDTVKDYKIIRDNSWALNTDLLIFDEIHKMKNWKQYLKGVYDGRREGQSILVTGSARMDTFRQTGDSLAGRYYHYRINPLSVKELQGTADNFALVEKLLRVSGFPEPYCSIDPNEYSRWKNQYYTDLIREDILEFSRIQEIRAIKLLLEMLRQRVGSPISSLSLAEDLQISPTTVRKYIHILESLYIVFLVPPFHKNIARSIRKEPKVYFYDSAYIEGDAGLKLENLCALSILKHAEYQCDAFGKNLSLRYIRTKDGKEIDFAIVQDDKIMQIVEVKLSDSLLSKNLLYFSKLFADAECLQLVHNLEKPQEVNRIKILPAGNWLGSLSA